MSNSITNVRFVAFASVFATETANLEFVLSLPTPLEATPAAGKRKSNDDAVALDGSRSEEKSISRNYPLGGGNRAEGTLF